MANIHSYEASNSNLLILNGKQVVAPSEMQVVFSDLDSENSFRSVTGKMQRDRICMKRKIECTWNMLTASELKVILQAVECVFFGVSYYDPYDMGTRNITAYVGDRTMPAAFFRGGEMYYKSVTMNFVEQ